MQEFSSIIKLKISFDLHKADNVFPQYADSWLSQLLILTSFKMTETSSNALLTQEKKNGDP